MKLHGVPSGDPALGRCHALVFIVLLILSDVLLSDEKIPRIPRTKIPFVLQVPRFPEIWPGPGSCRAELGPGGTMDGLTGPWVEPAQASSCCML